MEMSNNSSPTVAKSSAFQSPFGWDTSAGDKSEIMRYIISTF